MKDEVLLAPFTEAVSSVPVAGRVVAGLVTVAILDPWPWAALGTVGDRPGQVHLHRNRNKIFLSKACKLKINSFFINRLTLLMMIFPENWHCTMKKLQRTYYGEVPMGPIFTFKDSKDILLTLSWLLMSHISILFVVEKCLQLNCYFLPLHYYNDINHLCKIAKLIATSYIYLIN